MLSHLAKVHIRSFLLLNAALMSLVVGATTIVAAINTDGGTRGFLIAGGGAALLLVAFSAWWIARRLVSPLQNAVAAGKQMVAGDLDVSFDGAAAGEVAEVRQVFKELKDKLTGIVRDVRSGSIAIEQIAFVINHDNTALSTRNESNAGALEETAASLEQLTATVKNNADNATQANLLVSSASTTAVNGGQVMERVVDTMASIKQSSNKIVDIISVIDGIAFQTNILALNAAVEAARAGEQGRGFAVVAGEVRNLAQRSASAAKEIKGLIADSVERVESGAKLVDEAGKAMTEIVTSVKHVAGFMSDIATASQEQSLGIMQVNESITQFDSMTQENGKLVESALQSVEILNTSAATLAESVAKFTFGVEVATADEAVALVKQCVAFAREHGRQALIDEVNKLDKGRFIFKDLYLVLYDPQCILLGHGTNRHFVGANGLNSADPDGKLYNQEIVRIGMAKSSGWVTYKFAHPVSQEIKKKSAYVESFEDVSISCGCYAD